MMKKTILLLVLACTLASLFAQTFTIDFTGTGDTTVVDSVMVKNLGQGNSIMLLGSDVLTLTVVPAINPVPQFRSDYFSLRLLPNPMTDQSNLQIQSVENDLVKITLYDMAGRMLANNNMYLNAGVHSFQIEGIHKGIYLVAVEGSRSTSTTKLICEGSYGGTPRIDYMGISMSGTTKPVYTNQAKSANTNIDMECTEGECLLFTAYAGDYVTVIAGFPDASKTISFDFKKCMDADSNFYPTVAIGEQIWMAANLRTSHFNDGTPITKVPEASEWSALESPGYSWFDNDSASNALLHGALYNWFAVDTGSNNSRNVCPSGWHLPAKSDLDVLAETLGSKPGGKLKDTGTDFWENPNVGATNESGFTAYGSGWRGSDGNYYSPGVYACWWTNTPSEQETGKAWYLELEKSSSAAYQYTWFKACGFSVRCLKD